MLDSKIVNIFLAMALLIMSACSADDEVTPYKQDTGKGSQKIRFTASVSSPVQNAWASTRSWADSYNDRLPINSMVQIWLYAYDDSNPQGIDVANYMYNMRKDEGDRSETWTTVWFYLTQSEVDEASGRSSLAQSSPSANDFGFSDPEDALPVFPSSLGNDGYVDAIAVFLPEGNNDIWENGNLVFTASADQTTEAAVVSSDLLTNAVSSTMKSDASAINLDMRHRMCKVLVQFNPTEDLTQDNMPNNTYLMEHVKTQLTVNLKTGSVTTTGSTGTVTAKLDEPFFIAPQTIPAGTELLKFNLRNVDGTASGIKNVTLVTTTDLEFREGTYYVLTVNVGVRYITLTTTIRGWTGETINFDKIIL